MNVVFLAHGSISSYYQVIFCIFTLHHQWKGQFKDVKVIIYTDNDVLFKKYLTGVPYQIELLTKKQTEIYKGPDNYIHRIKPCIFIDYFAKYQQDLFYMDGDTFFNKDPRPLMLKIHKDTSIMNVNESDLNEAGELETMHWLTLRKNVRNNKFLLKGQSISIPLTTRIWNSGVTGMSYQNADLLKDVLDLTDQMYAKSSVFYTEQFTLSYILQNNTQLIDSEDYIVHYWEKVNEKKMFDYYIDAFFKANKNDTIDSMATKANDLILKYNQLEPMFIKTPLLEKIRYRFQLIKKIAMKGHL